MSEETKRLMARIVAWGGWLVTLVYAYLRAMHIIPQSWSIFAVMAIGAAILAGLSLSRQRLTDTIVGALRMGYELAREEHDDIYRRLREVEAKGDLRKRSPDQSLPEEGGRDKVRQGGPDDGGR